MENKRRQAKKRTMRELGITSGKTFRRYLKKAKRIQRDRIAARVSDRAK